MPMSSMQVRGGQWQAGLHHCVRQFPGCANRQRRRGSERDRRGAMLKFGRTPGEGVDRSFFAAWDDDSKAIEWMADLAAAKAERDCAGADIANGGEQVGGSRGKVTEQIGADKGGCCQNDVVCSDEAAVTQRELIAAFRRRFRSLDMA